MIIRTEEQWRVLFQQQLHSGFSASQFCQQHKICPKHFSLRKKQLGLQDERPFIALQIESPATTVQKSLPALSLTQGSSILHFEHLPPAEWLSTFLKDLA